MSVFQKIVEDCTLKRAPSARGVEEILPAAWSTSSGRVRPGAPLLGHFQLAQFGLGLFKPAPVGGSIEFEAKVLP